MYFSVLFVLFFFFQNSAFNFLDHKIKSQQNLHLISECVPGEKAAGGVDEVRLGSWGQAAGGDLEIYLTVVCLQVDNHS